MRHSYLANLSHAVHMEKMQGRAMRSPIIDWDAGPDLAQATWEWPARKNPSKALWQAYANDFWSNARLVKATWAKP